MNAPRNNSSTQSTKEFIDYRFNNLEAQVKEIDSKINNFQFSKQTDTDKLEVRAESLENRVTIVEQKLRPIEKVYYLILGTLVTGIIGFGFFVLQHALGVTR